MKRRIRAATAAAAARSPGIQRCTIARATAAPYLTSPAATDNQRCT